MFYVPILGYAIEGDTMLVFMPKLTSLHSLLHEKQKTKLNAFEKITIAIELAKGLEQMQSSVSPPLCHGHLTTKNIFVERDETGIRVMIGDIPLFPLLNYASTIMDYRP